MWFVPLCFYSDFTLCASQQGEVFTSAGSETPQGWIPKNVYNGILSSSRTAACVLLRNFIIFILF